MLALGLATCASACLVMHYNYAMPLIFIDRKFKKFYIVDLSLIY